MQKTQEGTDIIALRFNDILRYILLRWRKSIPLVHLGSARLLLPPLASEFVTLQSPVDYLYCLQIFVLHERRQLRNRKHPAVQQHVFINTKLKKCTCYQRAFKWLWPTEEGTEREQTHTL